MTTASINLMNDHVHILRLTYVMQVMAQQKSKDVEHFKSVVSLIRNFADGVHHIKEEKLYFPMMVTKGFSTEQGPVAVMLNDHEQGRMYVKGMVEGISLASKGLGTAFDDIYRHMFGYAELLQGHISKENNILFRMADDAFDDQDQEILVAEFAQAEDATESEFKFASATSKIAKLAAIYGVEQESMDFAQMASQQPMSCHG
jgi:hemerythrin-like domain-containing protein